MKNKLKIKCYLEQFDSIENQTFIITGANSGLGYSTTKHLASLGAMIIMACRNLDKAELAKNEIKNFIQTQNFLLFIMIKQILNRLMYLSKKYLNHTLILKVSF